jgi:hypothetical protein
MKKIFVTIRDWEASRFATHVMEARRASAWLDCEIVIESAGGMRVLVYGGTLSRICWS